MSNKIFELPYLFGGFPQAMPDSECAKGYCASPLKCAEGYWGRPPCVDVHDGSGCGNWFTGSITTVGAVAGTIAGRTAVAGIVT